MYESLIVVIKADNRIKSNALPECPFRHFCGDNDEDFTRLLLHTEIHLVILVLLLSGEQLSHFSVTDKMKKENHLG